MSKRITEEVCLKFFQKMPDADGKGLWKCQCGKILKRQEGSGWTNLRMHIISQHPDASKQFEENPENGQSTLLDPSRPYKQEGAKRFRLARLGLQ